MHDLTPLSSPSAEVRIETRLDQKTHRLRELVQTIESYQKSSLRAAEALAEIMDDELWKGEASSFYEFAEERFGYRRRRAYQLAKAGRVYTAFQREGIEPLPRSEAQVRPLTALDKLDDQERAWKTALQKKGDARRVTLEDVELAVAEVQGRPRRVKDDGALGQGEAMSQRARDYAVVEDALAPSKSPVPSAALHAEHYGLLGRLDPVDQAEVWARVAEAERNGTIVEDGLLEAGPEAKDERRRKSALKRAVVALADELGSPSHPTAHRAADGPLRVLLEKNLLPDAVAQALDAAGATTIGGAILAEYASAGSAIAALVAALDQESEDDIKSQVKALKRPDLLARRQMVRTRIEPDVAAWAWPVLVPHPMRTAATWLPDRDAGAPCYVPARLTQPVHTAPDTLVVTAGKRPEHDIPTARCALIAPRVDLLHQEVPDAVVTEVLTRAEAAENFIFLATTRDTRRLSRTYWPPNVYPVVPVTTPEELEKALNAFETSACKGALVFVDYETALSSRVQSRIKKHVSAALVRGQATGRATYDALLSLRGSGLALHVSDEVSWRPQDTPFRTARPRQAALPGAPGSGIPPL